MKGNGKKAVRMTTELGFQIETTQTYKDAEHLAEIKEFIEDKTEALKLGLDYIIHQMREDKVSKVTVKAPGGSLFTVVVKATETKAKIKKATKPENVVLVA